MSNFFSPVNCSKNKTFNFIENYFAPSKLYNGKRYQVVEIEGKRGYKAKRLVNTHKLKTSWLETAAKVASYMTLIIPAIMLVAKAIARSLYKPEIIPGTFKVGAPDPILLPNSSPQHIGAIYQTMKAIDDIFHKFGIVWWAEGGTTLGLERHGAIIPWDDDGDIHIYPGMEEKLLNQKFLDEQVDLQFIRTESPVEWDIIKEKIEASERYHLVEKSNSIEFFRDGENVDPSNRDLYDLRCLFLHNDPEVLQSVSKEQLESMKETIRKEGCDHPLNGYVTELINPAIQAEFKKLGLRIVADNWQGFKVFPIKCPNFGHVLHWQPTAGFYINPHVDIFVTAKEKDSKGTKLVLTKRAKEVFPKDYFYEKDLFGKEIAKGEVPTFQDLRRAKFGPIEIYTAKDNKPHLDTQYGNDWGKVAYRFFSHAEDSVVDNTKVEITEFEPAEYEFPYESIPMSEKQ